MKSVLMKIFHLLRFIFAEGAKPSSTAAGENSVVQMLGSLFDMVEREYGMFATRFYRAFRPKAGECSGILACLSLGL